jgi:probable HAF family extracellular repeat protein
MRRLTWSALIGLLFVVQASAATDYSLVRLQKFSAHEDMTGWGLSSDGRAVGQIDSVFDGPDLFYFNGTTNAKLPALPLSSAEGVNSSGTIVGFGQFNPQGNRGYIYQGGTYTPLPTLGGAQSNAYDINDAGQITGSADVDASTSHAYRYHNGNMQGLGTLNGAPGSIGFAINALGDVVGWSNYAAGDTENHHAFRWSNGSMTDLGALGTGTRSIAYGINNLGQVVGRSSTAAGDGSPVHAFLYDGTLIDLGTGGEAGSEATGINDTGEIVGRIGNFAAIHRNGNWAKLDDLIDAPGVSLLSATDINDAGQVLAYGLDTTGPEPGYYTFILTPIPEPTGLALLGVVAITVRRFGLARARRSRL